MTKATYDPADDTYQVPGGPRVPAVDIARAHTLAKPVTMPDEAPPEPLPVIMQFFAYEHLPAHLQATSRPFYNLAHIILCLPNNAERAVSLRKLLEAKDAAVRAKISK